MKLFISIILLLSITGCNTYSLRSEPEPQVNISDYATWCQNINDNYKIQIWCQLRKSGGYTFLQVFYPSLDVYDEYVSAVNKELSAPYCLDVANTLKREAAVQYFIQGSNKDIIAHNSFDCETHEVTGWETFNLNKDSGETVDF